MSLRLYPPANEAFRLSPAYQWDVTTYLLTRKDYLECGARNSTSVLSSKNLLGRKGNGEGEGKGDGKGEERRGDGRREEGSTLKVEGKDDVYNCRQERGGRVGVGWAKSRE